MEYGFEKKKETKEEKKERRKKEHMRRAQCIEQYQQEAMQLRDYLAANKDNLTKGEIKALKAKFKEKKGMAFELKHPILNGTKNVLIGLYELFEDIMDAGSAAYEHTYGGEGYTDEDMQRVAIAMNQFGPVGASMVREEIEARIESESSKGSQPDRE